MSVKDAARNSFLIARGYAMIARSFVWTVVLRV